MTQHEYIIPLCFDTKAFSLFRKDGGNENTVKIKETVPSIERSVSVRPKLALDDAK